MSHAIQDWKLLRFSIFTFSFFFLQDSSRIKYWGVNVSWLLNTFFLHYCLLQEYVMQYPVVVEFMFHCYLIKKNLICLFYWFLPDPHCRSWFWCVIVSRMTNPIFLFIYLPYCIVSVSRHAVSGCWCVNVSWLPSRLYHPPLPELARLKLFILGHLPSRVFKMHLFCVVYITWCNNRLYYQNKS